MDRSTGEGPPCQSRSTMRLGAGARVRAAGTAAEASAVSVSAVPVNAVRASAVRASAVGKAPEVGARWIGAGPGQRSDRGSGRLIRGSAVQFHGTTSTISKASRFCSQVSEKGVLAPSGSPGRLCSCDRQWVGRPGTAVPRIGGGLRSSIRDPRTFARSGWWRGHNRPASQSADGVELEERAPAHTRRGPRRFGGKVV